MAHAGSGQGSAVRLRVASWGDPGLDVTGASNTDSYAVQQEGLSGAADAAASTQSPSKWPEASPEASASQMARHSTDSDSGEGRRRRRHNLRPRLSHQNAAHEGEDPAWVDDAELGMEVDDSEEDVRSRGKKRVGRPLAYTGDPNAPHLTEEERRRLRRRAANRESARRVRNKQQEFLEELQQKMASHRAENVSLAAHVAEVESHNASLLQKIEVLQGKCSRESAETARLRRQVEILRQKLAELGGRAEGQAAEGGSAALLGSARQQRRQDGASGLPILPSASYFHLPSLQQLTSVPSRELLLTPGIQRQPSVQPPPEMGRLPDIQPLTGLQRLGSPSPQAESHRGRRSSQAERGQGWREVPSPRGSAASPESRAGRAPD